MVELSCAGYPVGRLRLLATTPPRTIRVRDDHGGPDTATDVGVKAIDFYVRPPIAHWIETLEGAGCRARSEPIRWEIGTVESEEINISGPDGYPMLLMVAWRHPEAFRREWDGAKPFSEVATTSVVCGDLDDSRYFYSEVLGLTKFTDDEVADEYRELADTLTGVPSGTRVRLTLYGAEGEPSGKLLLVHFYEVSVRRLDGRDTPRPPGRGDVHPYDRGYRGTPSSSEGLGELGPCCADRGPRIRRTGDGRRRTQRRAVRNHRSGSLKNRLTTRKRDP